jgi:hypothetical protein
LLRPYHLRIFLTPPTEMNCWKKPVRALQRYSKMKATTLPKGSTQRSKLFSLAITSPNTFAWNPSEVSHVGSDDSILLMYLSGTISIPNWSAPYFPSAVMFPLHRVSFWVGWLSWELSPNYHRGNCLCNPGRCWSRAGSSRSCTGSVCRLRGRARTKDRF